jgi:alanine dehydrogenase
MRIGVPTEIKAAEDRVALTPGAARQLAHHGHTVLVQSAAGSGAGLPDDAYRTAGAVIVDTAEEVWSEAELVVKVKEPQPAELALIRPGQALFTYLHLAPAPALAAALQEHDCIAIGYETVTDAKGGLPLLAPMSEVAGRMTIQAGATALERQHGGAGILLGGVPGTPPARVAVLGGGTVGTNAARMAAGIEAHVTVLDTDLDRLRRLDMQFGRLINTVYANIDTVEQHVLDADLVIGAALVPGAEAPRLITAAMVARMRPGSVIVDVSIDQGGCAETSRPTTHLQPTFVVSDVVHYCVSNMPGAVSRTSTFALTNATTPFVLQLADRGIVDALRGDGHLRAGLNVYRGALTHPGLAPLGPVVDAAQALSGR